MADEPANQIDYYQRRGWTRKCPECDGWGERSVWGAKIVSFECRHCGGTGEVPVASSDGQSMNRCSVMRREWTGKGKAQ